MHCIYYSLLCISILFCFVFLLCFSFSFFFSCLFQFIFCYLFTPNVSYVGAHMHPCILPPFVWNFFFVVIQINIIIIIISMKIDHWSIGGEAELSRPCKFYFKLGTAFQLVKVLGEKVKIKKSNVIKKIKKLYIMHPQFCLVNKSMTYYIIFKHYIMYT